MREIFKEKSLPLQLLQLIVVLHNRELYVAFFFTIL